MPLLAICSVVFILNAEHIESSVKIFGILKSTQLQNLRLHNLKFFCIVAALFFATLGDIFLLEKTQKRFLLGTASFFVCHIFWITYYIHFVESLNWYFPVIAVFVYGLATIFLYHFVGSPKGIMGIFLIAYALILSFSNFVGLMGIITTHSLASLFCFIGSAIFIISDTALGYSIFKTDFSKSRFIVMLTYILAQIILALGVCVDNL
ncbi:MAG: lysoplasmalogenase [Treponema sp.]|nr:lysoplasmalogenase [Treponema sp.]